MNFILGIDFYDAETTLTNVPKFPTPRTKAETKTTLDHTVSKHVKSLKKFNNLHGFTARFKASLVVAIMSKPRSNYSVIDISVCINYNDWPKPQKP